MAYQIAKGWPSEGALDEVLVPSAGADIVDGIIAVLKSTGKVDIGTYQPDGSNADETPFFIIDKETVRGTKTGLQGAFIIEADQKLFSAGIATYTLNQKLTVALGKFTAITNKERAVAKVIKKDEVAGLIRLLWISIN